MVAAELNQPTLPMDLPERPQREIFTRRESPYCTFRTMTILLIIGNDGPVSASEIAKQMEMDERAIKEHLQGLIAPIQWIEKNQDDLWAFAQAVQVGAVKFLQDADRQHR